MYVEKAVVLWTRIKTKMRISVKYLLDAFCDEGAMDDDDDWSIDKSQVGMEIISRYKGRICKIRSQITEDILICITSISAIINNDKINIHYKCKFRSPITKLSRACCGESSDNNEFPMDFVSQSIKAKLFIP